MVGLSLKFADSIREDPGPSRTRLSGSSEAEKDAMPTTSRDVLRHRYYDGVALGSLSRG